jgi:RecA-family ATPase
MSNSGPSVPGFAAARQAPYIPMPEGRGFTAQSINLCHSDADLKRLLAEIPQPTGFIVIDTLSRVLAGGNENGPEDMGALVMNVDRLRAATGATVLLVHHTGKDASEVPQP